MVTGASAGVGRATAQAFAKRGELVGLLARGREGLEGASTEVESLGGKALAITTDVCRRPLRRAGYAGGLRPANRAQQCARR